MNDHDKLTDEQLDELERLVRMATSVNDFVRHAPIDIGETYLSLIADLRTLRALHDEIEPLLRDMPCDCGCEPRHKGNCSKLLADAILVRHYDKKEPI